MDTRRIQWGHMQCRWVNDGVGVDALKTTAHVVIATIVYTSMKQVLMTKFTHYFKKISV